MGKRSARSACRRAAIGAIISGWRIKQKQVSTTGLVDTKQQPSPTKRRQYSEALKRQMVAETPGARSARSARSGPAAVRQGAAVFGNEGTEHGDGHDC